MKIFQIFTSHNDDLLFCHWDATAKFPTLESTTGKFPPDVLFVEAPDYVFEGWGFDPSAEGDARFIKPELPEPSEWTTPEGEKRQWMYDDATGTFYIADENGDPVENVSAEVADMQAALELLGVQPAESEVAE